MTWPLDVDWTTLRFGVELEFVGGKPDERELPPGWTLVPEELLYDERGILSGAEWVSPPLAWDDRESIRLAVERLKTAGVYVTGAAASMCTSI